MFIHNSFSFLNLIFINVGKKEKKNTKFFLMMENINTVKNGMVQRKMVVVQELQDDHELPWSPMLCDPC